MATSVEKNNGGDVAAEDGDAIRKELTDIESDIETLSSLITSKRKRAQELRRKLGIGPLDEIKHDIEHGFKVLNDNPVVKKMDDGLRRLSTSVSTTFENVQKSEAYKNLEHGVGSAYGTVKDKTMQAATVVKSYTFDAHLNDQAANNGTASDDQKPAVVVTDQPQQ